MGEGYNYNMMKDNNCNQKIAVVSAGDVPIDTFADLPDYIWAERDVVDQASGDVMRTPVRVPSTKLFPTANMDNVTSLETNNNALNIPEGQVRAGYIANEPGANIMKYADANHAPMFLMLGDYTNGTMLVQSTGFVNMPEGHHYIVGTQYYVGENGEPTTSDESGYKLFVPVSNTKLMVNL